MAKIIYAANGRPNAVCPYCERLHPIVRSKGYEVKSPLRFRCSACKKIFYPSDEQMAELTRHFAQKNKAPGANPPSKKAPVKTGPAGDRNAGAPPDPPPKKKTSNEKKPESIWDRIAGGGRD